jgi:hypothetical protein
VEDEMKKGIIIAACLVFAVVSAVAQDKKESDQEYKLTSQTLDQQGGELDKQVTAYAGRMADIIKKYNLLKTTGIRIIPYQTTYVQGADFIEMEKYSFIKDDIYNRDVVGVQSRRIKLYTSGDSISKIESEIYDHFYWAGTSNIVRITDPSPLTAGTDDITFTHIVNGKTFLDNKKLADIKNTTAYPIRNELKREFLVPHMSYFMNSLLFIAEAYYKGMKDSEEGMTEYLKKAKKF